MAAFMKNFALIGTGLFISHFGSGSFSLDSALKAHILKCRKLHCHAQTEK